MNTDLKEALLPDHDSLYSDDDSPRTGRRSLDVSLLSPRKVRILLGLFAASVILNAFLLTVVLFQTKLAIPRLASRYGAYKSSLKRSIAGFAANIPSQSRVLPRAFATLRHRVFSW